MPPFYSRLSKLPAPMRDYLAWAVFLLDEAVSAIAILLIMAAGWACVFLVRDEVPLSFFMPEIEYQIGRLTPQFEVDVAAATLVRVPDQSRFNINIVLRDIALRDSSGQHFVVEETAIGLDRSQLARARLVPGFVDMSDASFRLVSPVSEGEGFAPAPDRDAQVTPVNSGFMGQLLSATLGGAGESGNAFSHLDFFHIDEATVVLVDAQGEMLSRFDGLLLDFVRDRTGLRIRALAQGDSPVLDDAQNPDATISSQHFQRLEALLMFPDEAEEDARLEAWFEGLPLKSFFFFVPTLRPFLDLDFAVGGEMGFDVSREGVLRSGLVRLGADAGSAIFPTLSPTRHHVREMQFEGFFDFPNSSISVRRLEYRLAPREGLEDDLSRMLASLRGRFLLAPEPLGDEADSAFLLSLSGENIFTRIPGAAPEGLVARSLAAKAYLDPTTGTIHLQETNITSDEGRLGLVGQLRPAPGDLGGFGDVDLAVNLYDFPFTHLLRLFPASFSPASYNWISRNVESGTIREGIFHVRSTASADSASPSGRFTTGLSFSFDDAAFSYAPGMAPASQTGGRCTLRVARFACQFQSGEIILPEYAPISLIGGEFIIPDVRRTDGTGEAQVLFDVQGQLPAMLEWFDAPLQFLVGASLPEWLTGADSPATLQAKLTVPLRRDISFADIGFHFEGSFENLTPAQPIFSPSLPAMSNANGSFILASNQFSTKGEARLGDVPVQFSWEQDLSPRQNAPYAKFSLNGDFPDYELPLPAGLTPLALSGAIELSGQLSQFEGEGETSILGVELNGGLEQAELHHEMFGWHKEAGVPGTFTLSLTSGEEQISISRFHLTAPAFDVLASFVASPQGDIIKGRLNAQASDGTNFSMRARPLETGVRIDMKADQLDMRPLIAQGFATQDTSPNTNAPPRELVLLAEVEDIIGHDDVSLSDARLYFHRRNGGIEQLNFAANLISDDDSTNLHLWRDPDNKSRLLFTSGDAALTARAAGFAGLGLLDGGLVVEVFWPEGDDDISGRLVIRDFAIKDSPVALQWLSLGLQDSDLSFTRLSAPFVVRPDRIRFGNSVMTSPSLGIFFSGDYHQQARWLSFEGTLSPVYGINRLLSIIPLFGPILTGTRGEGLIGVHFSIEGDIDAPAVNVNPASILMPGILRDFFRSNPRPAPAPPEP